MNYKKILLVSQTLLLLSCVKIKDKKSSDPVSESVSAYQMHTVEYQAGEQPNQYTALIPIPEGANTLMRKTENNEVISIACDFREVICFDEKVESGKKYEYIFSKGLNYLKIYSSQVPRDLVVDKLVEITTLIPETKNTTTNIHIHEYRRLFFTPEGKLITLGKNISFSFEDIISNGGEILSFLPDQEAPQGQMGARGGELKIESQKAEGKLFITMRGQKGGRGKNGEPWAERAANGKRGTNASYQIAASMGESILCLCLKNPMNGQSGEQGLRGRSGYQGQRGGNSGSAFVQIHEENAQFEIVMQTLEGLGGEGGYGAEGQLGGLGGSPGNHNPMVNEMMSIASKCVASSTFCIPALSGNEGVKGLPGADGSMGQLGVKESSCVQIGIKSKRCE